MHKTPPIAKMIIVLVVIAICSGGILSLVWSLSEEKIIDNQKKLVEEAIYSLDPRVKHYKTLVKNDQEIYFCYDESNSFVSKFFIANGNGFQGNIKVAVATTTDWNEVLGIKVLEQLETPGLGSDIAKPDFEEGFKQLSVKKPIQCIKTLANKGNSEVQAVTGATISSKAVADIINNRIAELKEAEF